MTWPIIPTITATNIRTVTETMAVGNTMGVRVIPGDKLDGNTAQTPGMDARQRSILLALEPRRSGLEPLRSIRMPRPARIITAISEA